MKTWQIENATTRFGELLDACLMAGPQWVTRRGVEIAVLVPIAEMASAAGELATDAQRAAAWRWSPVRRAGPAPRSTAALAGTSVNRILSH
jgi:prevent-host-death family protein